MSDDFIGAVQEVRAQEEFDAIKSSKIGIFFWASWHEPSKPGGQMDVVWTKLSELHASSGIQFVKIEAEALPEISEKYSILVVPTFVLLQNGKICSKMEGANPPEIAKLVGNFATIDSSSSKENSPPDVVEEESLNSRLGKLINSAPVMLFMKGEPTAPKCGFSRKIVGILEKNEIKFETFDILQDEEVRQGLKTYSNWPTYPQLYVKGELIGGIDILQEMESEGNLATALGVVSSS